MADLFHKQASQPTWTAAKRLLLRPGSSANGQEGRPGWRFIARKPCLAAPGGPAAMAAGAKAGGDAGSAGGGDTCVGETEGMGDLASQGRLTVSICPKSGPGKTTKRTKSNGR
jgi:hypothetical protein